MTPSVVTVTPNGSVDTVLRRVGPEGAEEQEVLLVAQTAGGKGHNVARFLAAGGIRVVACGFAGGTAGSELGLLLDRSGVEARLTAIEGQTRRYVSIVGRGRPRISYHMRGPQVTADETARLLADVVAASTDAPFIVLAGRLPPGAPPDLYARLARKVGPSRVWLDSSGEALSAGLGAAPAVVKVNRDELRGLGVEPPVSSEPEVWLPVLRGLAARTGVGTWWVTLGAAGSIGLIENRIVGVTSPAVAAVNTTGAGDAFLAGLVSGALAGADVRTAAAIGSASAAAVCAQEAPVPPDPAHVTRLRGEVMVR